MNLITQTLGSQCIATYNYLEGGTIADINTLCYSSASAFIIIFSFFIFIFAVTWFISKWFK